MKLFGLVILTKKKFDTLTDTIKIMDNTINSLKESLNRLSRETEMFRDNIINKWSNDVDELENKHKKRKK